MQDVRGLAVSTDNAKSLSGYEAALKTFNIYRGDPVAMIDETLAADPDFAMGHVFRASVLVSMWERSIVAKVEESLNRLKELGNRCNDRERWHALALSRWVAGDWDGMRAELDRLSAEFPRDLLALQIGHLADFFHADRDNLRGRIARALPFWSREDAGYGYLLGMIAFGQEECASYGQAEENGRHALDIDPEDCWAQHAVAHVMEMQARQAEGIAFMESRQANWSQADNGFSFHNWWHTALYNLDMGNSDRALEIYDKKIRPEPMTFQQMMLDAAALLWRLHLQGIAGGHRWDELAATYEKCAEDGFYVFNDMHAMMAYVATGNDAAADKLLKAAEASAAGTGTNARMTREVGLPILRAIRAFERKQYAETVDLLMPVRYRAHAFGGSHAQRDILHRTLIEAAIRGNNRSLAHALTHERVSLKPHCPYSWRLHARASA